MHASRRRRRRDEDDPGPHDVPDGAPVGVAFQLIYNELRKLAACQLRGQRSNHTLRATALVHEAYIKLARHADITYRGRAHFLALVSKAMRQVVVDHARRRLAAKRNGNGEKVFLDGSLCVIDGRPEEIIELERTLVRLQRLDPQAAGIVELRFFGGLTEREAATVLGVSERTLRYHWAHARAWLRHQLQVGRPG